MWKVDEFQHGNDKVFSVAGNTGSRNVQFIAGSKMEAEWLANVLDEHTGTVVKLFCKNKVCQDFGGYITRTKADVQKTVFPCDLCGKPMSGGDPKAVPAASEKQVSASQKQAPIVSPKPVREFVYPEGVPGRNTSNVDDHEEIPVGGRTATAEIDPIHQRLAMLESTVAGIGDVMGKILNQLAGVKPEQLKDGDKGFEEFENQLETLMDERLKTEKFGDEIKY